MNTLVKSLVFIMMNFLSAARLHAQWSTPVLIDSTRQVIWPLIAVSPTRQITVVSFGDVYISEDLGKTFERRYAFIPPVTYYHFFYPCGAEYDRNGALWILWSWDECSDNNCTFSIGYWVYLSKSTDSGRTFQHIVRQRRGLAAVSNTPANTLLKIGRDNTVHFLYDSLPRPGEVYKLGNDLTYCKLPSGDPARRVDVRLPTLPDSASYYSYLNFALDNTNMVHILVQVSPGSTYEYPLYTRSTENGMFTGYSILDTQDSLRQLASYVVPHPSNGVLFLFGVADDYRNPSSIRYLSRLYEPTVDTLGAITSVSSIAFNISFADRFYWYSIRYSQALSAFQFYRFTDYKSPPVDSSVIGNLSDLQFALDDSAGKYIVMNDNSHRGYFAKKDVSTSVGREAIAIPREIKLQIAPNPFNGMTTLYVTIPRSGQLKLGLYDLLGRKVRDLFEGTLTTGRHRHILVAEDLPTGIYFVRLVFEHSVRTAKIALIN